MTKEITDSNFEQEILNSKSPILVDFWAPWCGPCKQLGPIVDELSKDMEGKVEVYKCNIDENPESPSKYAVRGIPTLMIFKDGKLVNSKVGSLPKSALYEWVRNNL
ncbi:Thioredoxin [sediment metagenome]|uniref:Thioredoxin n=1 Tax=sediment metagenome TaxID=749907 RepID=D9PN43_9ZZZZ